jgi:MerR family transcriptional regulator, light-induced transcriptional regulator
MPGTRTPHADATPEKPILGGDAEYDIDAEDDNDSRTPIEAGRPVSDNAVSEQLSRTIESEVIPRLMLAHRVSPEWGTAHARTRGQLNEGHVEDFAELVLLNDYELSTAYIEARLSEGVELQQVFLDLMAPAARMLGEYWDEDYCDFTQVTIGLSMLQQLLRKYSPATTVDGAANAPMRHALVMPAPGEQHTFGISMVEEFMRSGGWDVEHQPAGSSEDIVAMVQNNWYSLVGLSLSHGTLYQNLSNCIGDIRRRSRNTSIGVMVGGPFFIEHPELTESVGADATAANGPDAVVQARALVHRKQSGG